ncbi:DUF6932 family protein [Mesorhizobium japonicum]|uniref:DUF6932 family protein n=1 Tax=Mesorhizobium japonicum TaxID=2066070 RepID=UPI003B5BE865
MSVSLPFERHNDIVVFVIPALSSEGLLPPGIHAATWQDVIDRFGWNARRLSLLLGLSDALTQLASAGCSAIWLDGSFVTAKDVPGDYDACWDPNGMDGSRLDPLFVDFSPAGRSLRKSRFLGDLFVSAHQEAGSGMTFVDFFQRTRDGAEKGIVLLNPQEPR